MVQPTQPNQNQQTRKFNPWLLLGVFLLVVAAAGAFFLKGGGDSDTPPSIKIGSVLLKGQLTSKDFGVSFHYVDSDTALADFYDTTKCQGTDIKKAGLFTYSPGGEPGMPNKGWYVYPKEWGGNNQITDPTAFTVKHGRPFILVFNKSSFPNGITNTCFKGSGALSSEMPAVTEGTNGWVLVASNKDKLGEMIEAKECVKSVWVLNGAGTLGLDIPYAKVPLNEIDSHTLGVGKLLWVKLSCEQAAGEAGGGQQAGGDDLASLPELERIQRASGEAFCWLVSNNKNPLNVTKDDVEARQKIMEFIKKYGFVVDEQSGDIANLSKGISEGDFYKGKFVELVQQCAPQYIKDGKLNEDFGKNDEPQAEVANVTVSASVDVVNAAVEVGKSDVAVLGFKIDSGETREFDKIKIHVGGLGNLDHLYSIALKEGTAQLGTVSIDGKVVVINLAGYNINAGESRNFTLAVYVKPSAQVNEVFTFSLDSADDVTFKNGAKVGGSFPISNAITIVADPVPDLTDADIRSMTPVFSHTYTELTDGKATIVWNDVPETLKGRTLEGFGLQGKLGENGFPGAIYLTDEERAEGYYVIDLSSFDEPDDYYVKMCAIYENPKQDEDEVYCASEIMIPAWVQGANAAVDAPADEPQPLTDEDRNSMKPVAAVSKINDAGSVTLRWNAVLQNIKGNVLADYVVQYRKDDGGATNPTINSLGKNASQFSKTLKPMGEKYKVKICSKYPTATPVQYCGEEVTVGPWYPRPQNLVISSKAGENWSDIHFSFESNPLAPYDPTNSYTVYYYNKEHYDEMKNFTTVPKQGDIKSLTNLTLSDAPTPDQKTFYFTVKAQYFSGPGGSLVGESEYMDWVKYVIQ